MRMSEVSYTMDLQKPLWTKAAHLRDTGMAMEFITVKQLFTTDSKKKKKQPHLHSGIHFGPTTRLSSLNDKGNPEEVNVDTI